MLDPFEENPSGVPRYQPWLARRCRVMQPLWLQGQGRERAAGIRDSGPYPNNLQESVAYFILKENNKKWQPFPSILSISFCSSSYLLKFLLVNSISSLGLNLHSFRVWNHEFRNRALPLNRFPLSGKPYVSGFL